MYRVTDCLLYIQFPFSGKDSQFILTVIFIFISKLNHSISKLEMTAAPSLSVAAAGPQDTLSCCITSWVSKLIELEGLRDFLPGFALWTEQRRCLPAHNFMSKKNSAHFWILVLALINYGLWKEMTGRKSENTVIS